MRENLLGLLHACNNKSVLAATEIVVALRQDKAVPKQFCYELIDATKLHCVY
jgi:hypothetical protein